LILTYDKERGYIMWRKFLTILLIISVISTQILSVTVLAAGVVFAGGNGTSGDPYQIATPEQLNGIRNHGSAHFILIADIDLSVYLAVGGGGYNGGAGWNPIEISTYPYGFNGSLDGDGYSIKNFKINRTTSNIGLFGRLDQTGEIRNLKLTNVDITRSGSNYANVGSLVGTNEGTINNCSSDGGNINVSGNDWVFAGGLVGTNEGIINNSWCDINVTNSGQQWVFTGGLVGNNYEGSINNCYSFGTTSSSGALFVYAGGLIGVNLNGLINNCYSLGAASSSGPSMVSTGGLIGSSSSFENSVNNCYYNRETSGKSDNIGNGVPKTTAEMKKLSTFAGWDFAGVWKIGNNVSYPTLQWEEPWTFDEEITADVYALTWDSIKENNTTKDNVRGNLMNPLPTAGNKGSDISWSISSEDGGINTTTGEVTRPTSAEVDKAVTLIATVSKAGGITQIVDFVLVIKAISIDEDITADINTLTWDSIKGANIDADNVTVNLVDPLPTVGNNDTTILWSISPNDGWINTTTGEVTRPTYTQGNKEVTLTATVSKEGGVDQTKTFTMTIVKAAITSNEAITEEINTLTWDSIKGSNTTEDNVTVNLVNPLPTVGSNDTTILWSISPNDGWINTTTGEVTRPTYTQGNKEVTLTATVSKEGGVDQIKTFTMTIVKAPITSDEEIGEEINILTWDSIKGNNTTKDNVTTNLVSPLPTLASGDTVTISWSVSPNDGWINSTTGEVTRPTYTQGNKEVTLTATFSKEGGVDQIKTFTMTIVKAPITSDEEIGEEINILTWDSIKGNNTTKDNVTTNLVNPLPTLASGDTVTILWSVSPNDGWVNTTTGEVTRPTYTQGNKEVTLTATISKEGGVDQIKTFTMTIVKAPITSDEEIGEEINILTWDIIKGNNTTEDNVTTNLVNPLPTLASGDTITINWSISPNDGLINTTTGVVKRPSYNQGDKEVTLTATFSKAGGVDQIKTFVLTIKARAKSTGGSNLTNNDPEVTQNNTVTSENNNSGIASSTISETTLESAFNQSAVNISGMITAEVVIPRTAEETGYEITLPLTTLALQDTSRQIEIKTDIATITLPSNMLNAEDYHGAKDVTLTIESADKTKLSTELLAQIGNSPVIELELRIAGHVVAWNNEDAPVTVSISYEPTEAEKADPEHIVIWYIDGAGNAISVPSGKYDPATGKVTFTTTHFSKYAIVYVKKSYTDLDKVNWAKKQIEVLTSKGIMNSRTETEFAPIVGITRAEYISALVRTLNLSAKFDVNFSDVKLGDLYYKEIGTAKMLGITSGVGNNNFKQEATITRQEMLVMTERALRSLKRISKTGTMEDLEKFIDRGEIAVYSINSISALVKEGLIKGDGSKLNGSADTTKAEAAVFLYRIYNN
jgi:hypothetical protein